MQDISKKLFAYQLGQIFRVQRQQGICQVSDATIYGLLNGFEDVLDDIEDGISNVPSEYLKKAADILQPYFDDPDKPLSGYYQIEKDLEQAGINRGMAHKIFTYFQARGQFVGELKKLNTINSPIECKTFELDKYEV